MCTTKLIINLLKLLIFLLIFYKYLWNNEIQKYYITTFVYLVCLGLYMSSFNHSIVMHTFNPYNQISYKACLVTYFSNFFFNLVFFSYAILILNSTMNKFKPMFIFVFLFVYVENLYLYRPMVFFPNLITQLNLNLINPLIFIHPLLLFLTIIFFFVWFLTKPSSRNSRNIVGFFLFKQLLMAQKLLILTFFLGSWWAAQELNWGFWWNWDIVEVSLLVLTLNIIFFTHQFLLNKFSSISLRFIFFYIISQITCYFLLTKVDIFSSVHSFNVFTFLEKWFIYFFLFLLYLFFKTTINFLTNFNFFKKKQTVQFVFWSWILLFTTFMYFFLTILFSSFVFIEDLGFVKWTCIYFVFNFQFYWKLTHLYAMFFWLNLPSKSIIIVVYFFYVTFFKKKFFSLHFVFCIFFIELVFKLYISSYLFNTNQIKLSSCGNLLFHKHWCFSKILSTTWVNTPWYSDYGLFFLIKTFFFLKQCSIFLMGFQAIGLVFYFYHLQCVKLNFFSTLMFFLFFIF